MSGRDLLSEWSDLLIDGLLQAGLRDVVISPGSRSTPFVLAAARRPELRRWDILDERSAAFFALGQAKASGRPTLAICTSGSAAAHYLPAVIEAAYAYVPLLLLTADRPLELQHCAAPQTIDQVKLFGDQVRAFFELGLPDGSPGALRALRRSVAQAVHASQWPTPGPVHLNARARKPLEPRPAADAGEREIAERVGKLKAAPAPRAHPPELLPALESLEALAHRLAEAQRPLFVAGPAPLRQAAAIPALAKLLPRSGAVLLRDAASQLRAREIAGIDAFDVIADSRAALEPPDLVVQLGSAPTSTALSGYLAGAERWAVTPQGWNDPDSGAAELIVGEVAAVAAGLSDRLKERPPSGWQRQWLGAEEGAQRAIDAALQGELSEGAAVRIVGESLASGATLFVGNSLAIRELDLFCPTRVLRGPVLCQRGANGIDGLVSGAAGAATYGPVTLLLGDVSFLHDVGGLWAARLAGRALTIVVLHNQGGRIFEDLPLGRAGEGAALDHFTTPHALELRPAAELYGLSHRRVTAASELRAALGAGGSQLIEVALPPSGLEPLRRRILERLSAEAGRP